MRLLILGYFGAGSLESYYVNGFEVLGIEVDCIDIVSEYYKDINNHLYKKIINRLYPKNYLAALNYNVLKNVGTKHYDAILVFKGMTLFPSTISKLKYNCKIIANYNPDHPFKFYSRGSGNSNVLNSINEYDIYFTYSINISKALKKNFKVESECIPFGYFNAAENNTNFNDRKSVKFIGAYDKDRHMILKKISCVKPKVYGEDIWLKKEKNELNKLYQGKKIFGNEFMAEVHSSIAIINILRKQNIVESSHNMRTFEIPALGGVLISNYTEEQTNFFEPEKEMLFYNSLEEMEHQINKLLNSNKIVDTISKNAYRRSITSGYSYNERAKTIIQHIKALM